MENYFEEESCNLDKVLDEFEKNEDENVSPRFLDAKWNQILNPPSRLTENSALDNVSKSIIAIEAHLKDRSPSLTPCSNGEIECVAPELSTMVTEDTSMAEDRKAQPENICSTNALPCGEESLLADVTLDMSCGKGAAPGDSLSPCSTPTSRANANSENAVDGDNIFQSQLHVADTNQQLQTDLDCNNVATIETNVCTTVQRHSSLSRNSPLRVCESSTEDLNSPPHSVQPTSEVCQLSPSKHVVPSTNNDIKNISCQLDGPNITNVLTVGDDSSEKHLKASFLPSADRQVVHVFAGDYGLADQVALVNDDLQPDGSPELAVEHFSDSFVMNGDLDTTVDKKTLNGGKANVELGDADKVLESNADGTDALIALQNGCDSYGMQNPTVAHNPKSLPSKEDSVTEEKEIEECKSEYYANVYEQRDDDVPEGRGLLGNAGGDVLKNHLHSLCNQVAPAQGQTSKTASSVQPLSVPYGGARPKQPTHLKLQIPKPLSDMLQCDLVPPNAGCSSKNKNDVLNKSSQNDIIVSDVLRDEGAICSPGFDANGDLLGDYRGPNSPCLAASPDSPDNDLQAGQYGGPASKPFTTLGEVAPVWVPDSQAPNCMKCEARFTFTKRRHHCRACGKVFCAACCSLKCKLLYMDKKEARVCVICHSVLINGSQSREQRRVWFADGILPNGEAADAGKVNAAPAAGNLTVSHDTNKSSPSNSPSSEMSVMQQLEDGGPDPLVFVLNANLLAMVKIVNYVNRKCWCFTTKGMHAMGQAELVILLQCLPDEKCLPRDVFCHFVEIYREALAGNMIGNLGHSFVSQSFLGSKEHGGFLYVTPTYQSLQDLVLPAQPYLFGILIQKWETPWAKDFRNYQYTLPVVQGLVVDMEVRKTSIKIPSNRYNEMMKAMNKSNEHVLAGGTCFNQKADSHLVCVQNDDGNYQTQAISIHKQPRKVTGASFFVFSGALKPSSGFLAKSSIVEDGVMVQITAESMDALRQALREMKDFTITCGKADAEETQEHVYVQWVEDDKNFNKGVSSPIDGKSLESVTSVKISHGSEYKANGKIIRWTEVFFLDTEEQQSGLSDPADHSRLTENVAKAFCLALCPHLKLLKEDGMTRLGLRVTLDSDQVGYQAGSNGQPLPPRYTHDLDSALVPVIHGGTCQINEGPVTMELIFYILENIS
ncbi:hypothetical protein GDO78_019737 [Eleutherodactylus coqui]|uniref:FYVE-type domain-containing protein n=1 Tax=Eleutherodactylus coqui TaxID=57060 RepID=A0A8J6EIY5_ELECQ|nr:hypothetical protein GDO78_019737 [Eleutherodactylus coqui]